MPPPEAGFGPKGIGLIGLKVINNHQFRASQAMGDNNGLKFGLLF